MRRRYLLSILVVATMTIGLLLSVLPVPTLAEAPTKTEIVALRQENSKTFDLGNGKRALEVSLGAKHYKDVSNTWQDIDNSWTSATAPWNWQMTKDSYKTYALNNFIAGQVLKIEYKGSTIAFQPMALGWTNNLNQIQQISMPQNVAVSVTNTDSIGTIRWNNAYGTGRHFQWTNTPGRLEKLLQLDAIPPAPAQYIIDGGNPVLKLDFIFAPSSDLEIWVDGQLWDKSSKKQTVNIIEFRKAGEVVGIFNPVRYWDSSANLTANEGVGTTVLSKSGNNLYVSALVPYSWLQTAVYPVRIDPTWQVTTGSDDCRYVLSINDFSLTTISFYVGCSSAAGDPDYGSAARFLNITIPAGSIITLANLILTGKADSTTVINSRLRAQLNVNPATFSTAADFSARTWTSDATHVHWNAIPAWVLDTEYTSPDIKACVQEVINLANWASGNPMVILWDDFEKLSTQGDLKWRRGYSYDGSTTKAPKLVITYTTPSAFIPKVTIW